MRVEVKPLVPGVEDGGEAADLGAEPLAGSEFVAQRAGGGGEEEVVDLFGLGTEEERRSSAGRVKVTMK